MKLNSLILAFSMMAMASIANAEPKQATGQAMSWQCAPCHGINGQEFNEAMPPLAGMKKDEFVKAMIAFREGNRAAIIMDRVARGFTDDEIDAMAVWFEQQPKIQWENMTYVPTAGGRYEPK